MGLTTSFIDEQSMPMRYWAFVVESGVIFGLAILQSHQEIALTDIFAPKHRFGRGNFPQVC